MGSVMVQLGQTILSHILICQENNRQKGRTYAQEIREAWNFKRICQAMVTATLFSLSLMIGNLAWSMGINPALATVVGAVYFPASAFMSRWIVKKFYLWLEWIAVALMTLNSLSYALLDQLNKGAKSGG